MARWVQRIAVIPVLLVVSATVGCFGGPSGPGYFPSYIWPGDTIQTHAKPPGLGYFRDFDPQAARIEVTPNVSRVKCGEQVVLIATVYDKDGQARRARRVEWMIDGPGSIVEVDESGYAAGRGYKVGNRFAVSHTDYLEHKFTRGNSDPGDDFTVYPGQTWCVVTGAVSGETSVTAYAPGVFNWDKGRATARIVWGDGGGIGDLGYGSNTPLPRDPGSASAFSATARVNSLASLDIPLQKIAQREGLDPADLRVRYKYLGGIPADFVAPPNVSGTTAGLDFLEVPSDRDGRAPVRIKQTEPRVGTTDIGIEVYKDGERGQVVSRSKAQVEWTAAAIGVTIQAPKAVPLNQKSELTISVANNSKVEGSRSKLEVRFQRAFQIDQTTPPADSVSGLSARIWTIPALPAGQRREIVVPFRLTENGTFGLQAQVIADDGTEDMARAEVAVGEPGLKIALDPKLSAMLGERVPIKVEATNTGSTTLEQGVVTVSFGSGLEHESGTDQVKATLGTLAPGETRSSTVFLVARRTGQHGVRASVAAGGLVDRQETAVDVRKAELKIVLNGPTKLMPGEQAMYEIGVGNQGDVAVPNAIAKVSLPSGLSAERANEDGTVIGPSAVQWRLGDLPPGGKKTLKVGVVAEKIMDKGAIAASIQSGDGNRLAQRERGDADANSARAELSVSVAGAPALLLELAEPSESVPIGRKAGYRVVVKNKGNGPAKNVRLTVQIPEEYANVRGFGANRDEVRPEGSKIIFPAVREIPAGGTAIWTLEVEGAKLGDARVKAEVAADGVARPLSEEQSTKVIERRK